MTASDELSMLETAYQSILTGTVQSYTINGRQITKLELKWVAERMDILRSIVARETEGSVKVARFRTPE